MPCSYTYFQELSTLVSQKLATKGYFRGKKTLETLSCFSEAKLEEWTKTFELSLVNVE